MNKNIWYYIFGLIMTIGLIIFIVGITGLIFDTSIWWVKITVFGIFIYLIFRRFTTLSKEDKTKQL